MENVNKVVVFNDENGVLNVMGIGTTHRKELVLAEPIYDDEGRLVSAGVTRFETDEELVARTAAIDAPKDTQWRLVERSSMPEKNEFRMALQDDYDAGEIVYNMDKAKEIHMNNIRKLRDKKLNELDIETLKGNDVQAEKQVLRDIPQTFDLSGAETIEELRLLIPNELKD